jgi:hypothetical protein
MDPVSLSLLVLTLVKKFYDPEIRQDLKDVNAALQFAADEMNKMPGLRKPDGTDWTLQDFHEAQAKGQAINQQIRDEANGTGE